MNWRQINFVIFAVASCALWFGAARNLSAGENLTAGALAGVAAAATLRALWLGASLAGAPPKLIYILALVSVAVSWIVIATAAAVLVVWVAILGRDGRYMWAALISVILAGAAAWLGRQFFKARARRAPAGR